MARTFEASVRSSISTKAVHLIIAGIVLVMICFGSWMIDNLLARISMAILGIIMLAEIKGAASDFFVYAQASVGGCLDISDNQLALQSPVQSRFKPFASFLRDIAAVPYSQDQSTSKAARARRKGSEISPMQDWATARGAME